MFNHYQSISINIFTAMRKQENILLASSDFNIYFLSENDELLQLKEELLKAIDEDEDVLLFSSSIYLLNEHKIHVISPFRNASFFLKEYIDSIKIQHYNNYHVHLIDDCYTEEYDISTLIDSKITLKVNPIRKFELQNIIEILMTNAYEDEDIICFVDADDVLLHEHVFELINSVYSNDSNLFMTYRAMTYYNSERKNQKLDNRSKKEEFDRFRQSPWKVDHLRTFKYKLFKEFVAVDCNLNSLKDEVCEIIRMPYDMAILFTLI